MSFYFELINDFTGLGTLSFTASPEKKILVDDINKMASSLDININSIAIPDQKHTDIVKWIESSGFYDCCDGIASNRKFNTILSISVADCTPVCISDKVTGNFALVHSGWRGTKNKIVINAINLLLKKGSLLKDIIVYLGPSISMRNYEVDFDVAKYFSQECYERNGDKYLLDIKSQIIMDIKFIGILDQNIDYSNRCTFDDDRLCSYRRDGLNAGRMIFFMGEYDVRI